VNTENCPIVPNFALLQNSGFLYREIPKKSVPLLTKYLLFTCEIWVFDYISYMLSKRTKYGLKALAFIARNYEGKPVAVSEIAKSENIPSKFLESILLTLRKSGILSSKKGKGGDITCSNPRMKYQ
jgi:predicted transcriptional regulator